MSEDKQTIDIIIKELLEIREWIESDIRNPEIILRIDILMNSLNFVRKGGTWEKLNQMTGMYLDPH